MNHYNYTDKVGHKQYVYFPGIFLCTVNILAFLMLHWTAK